MGRWRNSSSLLQCVHHLTAPTESWLTDHSQAASAADITAPLPGNEYSTAHVLLLKDRKTPFCSPTGFCEGAQVPKTQLPLKSLATGRVLEVQEKLHSTNSVKRTSALRSSIHTKISLLKIGNSFFSPKASSQYVLRNKYTQLTAFITELPVMQHPG